MNTSPEMLIGMMLLLLVLALLLVVFLARGMRKGKKKKSSPPKPMADKGRIVTEEPGSEARGVAAVSETAASESLPDAQTHRAAPVVRAHEPISPERDAELLMRVWQDGEGRLVVEAEGQSYRRLFEIRDGDVGRRVLETINRLDQFAQGQESGAPAVSTPADQQPEGPVPTSDAESEMFLTQLQADDATEPQKYRITADPLPFRPQNLGQQSNITLNLASEVDELLQIRLKATPEYARRYIHVAGGQGGTLRFDVDGGHYSSLQDVPDSKVRSVIQAAISDWETRR